MLRLVRRAVVLALYTMPGFGALIAPAQTCAEPQVNVQVDVHVPVPVVRVRVPTSSEPPHRHPAPAREEPRPAPEEWAEPESRPRHERQTFQVPPDRVPGRGLCRIWFDDIPPDRQPPPMTCERAHSVARHHGGRVIWAESGRAHEDGRVASVSYGRVDFHGVPPDRLPPPGACRVWLEGVPPDRQPPPGPCEHAEREARRTGGRLLYMPGP